MRHLFEKKFLSHSPGIYKKLVCFFCAFNITRDMKNFVQISTISVLFNTILTWTKFSISPVTLTVKEDSPNFGNPRTRKVLWLSYMRKKVDNWLFKINSKIKDDFQIVLLLSCYCHATVMLLSCFNFHELFLFTLVYSWCELKEHRAQQRN